MYVAQEVFPSSSGTQGLPGKRFYRPELDLLRLGAFLLVFIAHTLPSPDGSTLGLHVLRAIRYTGTLGVPLFFLLSAYLITDLLFKELDQTGDIQISSFYARRVLRIWPLYFLMLFATALAGMIYTSYSVSAGALWAYLLLAGNWYTILSGNWLPLSALPLWSIGIEEQFYLIWPTVVRCLSRKMILVCSGSVWILCQLALWFMCFRHVPLSPVVWINSFTHFQYFALGSMISVVLAGRTPVLRRMTRIVMITAGLGTLFVCEFYFNVFSRTDVAMAGRTIPGYMLIGLGVVLLFLGVLGASIATWTGPLVKLGKISYGLYIYHAICVHLSILLAQRVFHIEHHRLVVAYGVGLPVSIGVAALSYRYVEKPFLCMKERFTIVRSREI
jgi:peptidoglycan/LPS O-acetylase OafA/YrhL